MYGCECVALYRSSPCRNISVCTFFQDDTENIEPVVAELPSYITTSPTTKWERCSYSDILYVPEPIAVEMISVVENEAPVAHIPKGVELHMHPPRGHGEVRSLMKRTSHNFSRYTKKSLRELLRQQSE